MEALKTRILLIADEPLLIGLPEQMTMEEDKETVLLVEWQKTLAGGVSKIDGGGYDLAIVDLGMSDGRTADTLEIVRERAHRIPWIVLAAEEDEPSAWKAVHGGAQDYLVKSDLDEETLIRSIRCALARHKLLEEKLETVHRDLERACADLDKFAYVASHDLKAPLRAIGQLSKWIGEDLEGQLEEDTLKKMALLRNRVRRMEKMIQDILQYSRAGRVEQEIETVDTAELLEDILHIDPLPEGFVLELNGDLPTFETRRGALRQVFSNLILNAVKHHDRPVGRIAVAFENLGSCFAFSVIDDGPGIPEEFREKVFDLFQTLKSRDEVEGTGLGLSITRKIVEHLGGTVQVDAGEGRGARITFSWPKRIWNHAELCIP